MPAAPGAPGDGRLKIVQLSVGDSIRMLPVGEVIYFEAADKYIRVLTASHEYLIRTPLKELLPQLDAHSFWQIHRGTVAVSKGRLSPARQGSLRYLSANGL